MEKKSQRTLGLAQLTFIAIGSTLASGVFSLSGDFAFYGSYPLAVLIGWLITGIGMYGLTMTFFKLSFKKPELTSGIYTYAREGFGSFMGFNSAWGFWIGVVLAQISFIALLFDTIGNFLPVFGDGSNLASIIAGSVMIWVLAWILSRGVDEAATLNVIVVIAKIIPIVIMLVAILLAQSFSFEVFFDNFAGTGTEFTLAEQIRNTTYVTLWVFIGIEGAVVSSARAKTTELAGRATIISFLSLLALYVVISILSMGVLTTEELAVLGNPPMAGILQEVLGAWGANLVNIGVIISLAGAMFTYTILCMETLSGPAEEGAFPKILAKKNKNGASTWAILLSTVVIQLFLIVIYFNESTYQAAYAASTSAIILPYGLTAFYYLKLVFSGEALEDEKSKVHVWIIALLGAAYSMWMIYGSGLEYILVSTLLYAPGIILYVYHRKEQKKKIFNNTFELITAIALVASFILTIVLIYNGTLSPF